MSYSRAEIAEFEKKIGKSRATLFRWAKQGCDLRSENSVHAWIERNRLRETNIAKSRRRRGFTQKVSSNVPPQASGAFKSQSNGQILGPPGKLGAGAALVRLEKEEEQGYRRLEAALANGNAVAIDAAQTYWLRVAETLRRLDRELVSRRGEEQMIALKTAQDAVTFVSEWLRISITTFLSAEGLTLAGGFKTIGELKVYFFERFKGVMFLTLKNAGKTNSPVPPWALERIKIAFNVEELQETAGAAAASGHAAHNEARLSAPGF
jgi:hypothetical protein